MDLDLFVKSITSIVSRAGASLSTWRCAGAQFFLLCLWWWFPLADVHERRCLPACSLCVLNTASETSDSAAVLRSFTNDRGEVTFLIRRCLAKHHTFSWGLSCELRFSRRILSRKTQDLFYHQVWRLVNEACRWQQHFYEQVPHWTHLGWETLEEEEL